MNDNSYERLAKKLDALPNGFPATPNGAELRLLEKIFTPEEANLAVNLRLNIETPEEIADRFRDEGIGEFDPVDLKKQLKGMAKKGLIKVGMSKYGLGFGILPFVVGIYEFQIARMDAEMARLFEDYYQQAFGTILKVQPAFHRVVPIEENIKNDMTVQPFESASQIVDHAKAWGVVDCICRLQKKLIGNPCEHPLDVCMVLGNRPGMFDHSNVIKAQTREEAHHTLHRAAEAGLVHTVSNSQEDIAYICNCCTCSCGILRGMAEMGIANVVARSPFVNQVDQDLCVGCEDCIESCQFGALILVDGFMTVNEMRCVGCGVCVSFCNEGALSLTRRSEDEIMGVPVDEREWGVQRSKERGVNIEEVL